METLHSTLVTSQVGPLFLAASARGLVALEFDKRLPGQQTIRPNPRDLRAESQKIRFEDSANELSSYIRELEEYFAGTRRDRKSTRLNSSHVRISYAVFCLRKEDEFVVAGIAEEMVQTNEIPR